MGTALQLLPVALSLLVLCAHFLRSGNYAGVAAALILIAFLGIKKSWAARTIQIALLLGVVEWVRTLVRLTAERAQEGRPAARMVFILGAVALVTGLSALVLETPRLRGRFGSR